MTSIISRNKTKLEYLQSRISIIELDQVTNKMMIDANDETN